jgi:hypothetical protein
MGDFMKHRVCEEGVELDMAALPGGDQNIGGV